MKKLITLFLALTLIFGITIIASADIYDFGGETIYFHGGLGPFGEGEIFEGRLEEAEDKFNVNIESENMNWEDTTEELMARLLSGESTNDIYKLQSRQWWDVAPQGHSYPVGDILDEEYYDSLPEYYQSVAENDFSYGGKKYGFGWEPGVPQLTWIAYNPDVFEEFGLTDPYELYEAGEWNWENFLELAEEVTRDTNGDGDIDTMSIWLGGPPTGVLNFALSNDARLISEVDGRYEFTGDEDEYIETIRFVRDLREKTAAYGWYNDFNDGNLAMFRAAWFRLSQLENFHLLPFPKGPNSDRYVFPAEANSQFVIPTNSSHPEGKVELVKYLYEDIEASDEALDNAFSDVAKEKRDYEILWKALESYENDSEYAHRVLPDSVNEHIAKAVEGEMGARAAMEAVADEAQAAIDDVLN
ncbi:MAG: ABC transporter substrate-binding protein [bacterium]